MKKLALILIIMAVFANESALALSGSGTETDPWLIESLADFQEFSGNSSYWAGHTRLETDIDLSGITYTDGVIASLTGVFDGNGHKIMYLTINAATYNIGLFKRIDGEVTNLGLEDCSVVSSSGPIGGIVGRNYCGTVSNCYSTGSVTGWETVGGLVGENYYGSVLSSYTAGSVTGQRGVGGLVGYNESSVFINCYSTASASGTERVGGLAGYNSGWILNSYSTGQINGTYDFGGLVGFSGAHGIIKGFWDTQTSGVIISRWGIGLPTSAMQSADTYLRLWWDFDGEITNGTDDIWAMPQGGGYPVLAWQLEDSGVANDDFADAQLMTVGAVTNGSTTAATGLDLTGGGYNDTKDVWYFFEVTTDGEYTVTVDGLDFDPTVGVFDETMTEMAFNDDSRGGLARAVVKAKTGRIYYIRVAGYDGDEGAFVLELLEGAKGN